jgi:hypothetical protein
LTQDNRAIHVIRTPKVDILGKFVANNNTETRVDLGLDGASLTAVSPVPISAALPLFAVGLGLLGLLGPRRKQFAVA